MYLLGYEALTRYFDVARRQSSVSREESAERKAVINVAIATNVLIGGLHNYRNSCDSDVRTICESIDKSNVYESLICDESLTCWKIMSFVTKYPSCAIINE